MYQHSQMKNQIQAYYTKIPERQICYRTVSYTAICHQPIRIQEQREAWLSNVMMLLHNVMEERQCHGHADIGVPNITQCL